MTTTKELAERLIPIKDGMDKVIMGQDKVKESILIGLLSGGHILCEGVPGTGKTLLALTLSRLIGSKFGRVQFTPDLMPTDLLGTNIFNQKTREFEFHEGPIFTDVLLADEINRTPPRTQSALLEAMQERTITIDGVRHDLSGGFFVLATQNPVEFDGTYPLPEAQRDRFLIKIEIDYPLPEDEDSILEAYSTGNKLHSDVVAKLEPVITLEEIAEIRTQLASLVKYEPGVIKYIRQIVEATRTDDSVQIGAGPRASIALLETSRALAVLRGRDFATPDDVKEMAKPVLLHRITLSPESEMEGFTIDDLLKRIFDKVEVPR